MNNNCYPCVGNKLLPMSWFVDPQPPPSAREGPHGVRGVGGADHEAKGVRYPPTKAHNLHVVVVKLDLERS